MHDLPTHYSPPPPLHYSILPLPRQDRLDKFHDLFSQTDIFLGRDVRVRRAFFGPQDILDMVCWNIPAQTCKAGCLAPLELAFRRQEKIHIRSQCVRMRRASRNRQAAIARGNISSLFERLRLEMLERQGPGDELG